MNQALIKKHWLLLTLVTVIALLLLVTIWQLVVSAGRFNAEKSQLQATNVRLNQLNNRAPFPSLKNVELERQNLEELVDLFNELNDRLREDQIEPRVMEAAQFMPLLENTLRRLRSGFNRNKITLPARFAFGFDRYAEGQLPVPDAIPRMVQQLLIIDSLCRVVIDARVSQVINVTREDFEGAPEVATPGRRRGAAPAARAAAPVAQPAEDDDLFSSQRFVFTLRGSERSVFDLLERLATLPMFTVVTAVELQNLRQETRERDAGGRQRAPAGQASAAVPPPEGERPDARGRQVIIGREDLDVKITVDVYQFAPSLDFNNIGQ